MELCICLACLLDGNLGLLVMRACVIMNLSGLYIYIFHYLGVSDIQPGKRTNPGLFKCSS